MGYKTRGGIPEGTLAIEDIFIMFGALFSAKAQVIGHVVITVF